MEIPFLSLKSTNQHFEDSLKIALEDFLHSGHYMLGKNVESFEKNFANYCHSTYCVGVANGLDALILILNSFGFKKDSEVIVPANTYFASILAIHKAGLKPVLVEPGLDDYLINVENIEKILELDAYKDTIIEILSTNDPVEFKKRLNLTAKYVLRDNHIYKEVEDQEFEDDKNKTHSSKK